jgi:hypothetical protein
MRRVVLFLTVLIALGVAACGGEQGVAPLALGQRVASESDAPGSQPDPVETRITATGIDEVRSLPAHLLFSPTDDDLTTLEEAGFVSAILDTRFYPREPGAEHVGDEQHLATLVLRLASEDGAADVAALLHQDGLEPCPGSCAIDISEFDVDGIPHAQGAQRITTAEDLKATGEEGDPFAAYMISFSDGLFAYKVAMFGPPDKVSEQQVEDAAKKLYERIKGSPPADE